METYIYECLFLYRQEWDLLILKNPLVWFRYDEEEDKIVDYQQVPLTDITRIEFGAVEQSFNLSFMQNKTKDQHCFR